MDEFESKSYEEFLNKSIETSKPRARMPAVGAAQITKPVK